MKYSGNIKKMKGNLDDPVQYYLPINDDLIHLNPLIGEKISIRFMEKINCISCGANTNKSFHQGYCYSCYISVPQTDEGVLRPEKDKSHLGISRDMEWAKENSLIDHIVYLSLTGDLKVGVTRHTQIPARWIDQGAIKAIKLARTPYRQLSGEIEVELKKHVSDKTNRNKMLAATSSDINLKDRKKQIASLLSEKLQPYLTLDNRITNIIFPFNNPGIDKFATVDLDKTDEISGKLIGIKGQYLIFDNGNVFNVRKHNGYLVEINS